MCAASLCFETSLSLSLSECSSGVSQSQLGFKASTPAASHLSVLTLFNRDPGFWEFLIGWEMAKDEGKWVYESLLFLGQWLCSLELC